MNGSQDGGRDRVVAELAYRAVMVTVFMSGYTDDVSLFSDGTGAGGWFLAKPFLPSQLTQTVCAILEGEAPA